jgi:hypothetical protein
VNIVSGTNMGNVLTAMHPDRGDGLEIWKGKEPWRIHQRFKCEKLLLEHPAGHTHLELSSSFERKYLQRLKHIEKTNYMTY